MVYLDLRNISLVYVDFNQLSIQSRNLKYIKLLTESWFLLLTAWAEESQSHRHWAGYLLTLEWVNQNVPAHPPHWCSTFYSIKSCQARIRPGASLEPSFAWWFSTEKLIKIPVKGPVGISPVGHVLPQKHQVFTFWTKSGTLWFTHDFSLLVLKGRPNWTGSSQLQNGVVIVEMSDSNDPAEVRLQPFWGSPSVTWSFDILVLKSIHLGLLFPGWLSPFITNKFR